MNKKQYEYLKTRLEHLKWQIKDRQESTTIILEVIDNLKMELLAIQYFIELYNNKTEITGSAETHPIQDEPDM